LGFLEDNFTPPGGRWATDMIVNERREGVNEATEGGRSPILGTGVVIPDGVVPLHAASDAKRSPDASPKDPFSTTRLQVPALVDGTGTADLARSRHLGLDQLRYREHRI
jgi:hypothetical protein